MIGEPYDLNEVQFSTNSELRVLTLWTKRAA